MREMPDEVLREIAKEKGRKGNASRAAKSAQKVLWERSGQGFSGNLRQGTYGTKSFRTADQRTGWDKK